VEKQRREDKIEGAEENQPEEQFKIKLSTRATNPEGLLEREI